MSDTNLRQSESADPENQPVADPGYLHVTENEDSTAIPDIQGLSAGAKSTTKTSSLDGTGTVEHLAARHTTSPLDANSPAVKQLLNELRTEITRILTGVRWQGLTVADASKKMVSLLDIGSLAQWQTILIPFLLEIDRPGNLLPVWFSIIKNIPDPLVAPGENPANTMQGLARRIAILMLGNYKYPHLAQQNNGTHAFWEEATPDNITAKELVNFLGSLAINSSTSLYAVPALVKLDTNEAVEALLKALAEAEGWAKVDLVEGILSTEQSRFYDMLLASGLDRVPTLENYVAVPLYRKLPLEKYLRAHTSTASRLTQQAALVFSQVLQNSMQPPAAGSQALPIAFERNLSAYAQALFEGVRTHPMWQNTLALHYLGTLLGRYWSEISHGALQDTHIQDAVYACLPMMPEVEHWMAGQGRETLLRTLDQPEDATLAPIVKALGEMREIRAIGAIQAHLEAVRTITDLPQAITIEAMCHALVQLRGRQALMVLPTLIRRTLTTSERVQQGKKRENLPPGDPFIPGSIVSAAAIYALGQLGDRSMLDTIQTASQDVDPYVRTQALNALKQLDAHGEDQRSRQILHELLNDPNDDVVRAACTLVPVYRDSQATPILQQLTETRPNLAAAAYAALQQLGSA